MWHRHEGSAATRRLTTVIVVLAFMTAGCGGSSTPPNPAAQLVMRTGAAQYEQTGRPKVDSAVCKSTGPDSYSCLMRYSFTETSGTREVLQTTVPVSCAGKNCTANWDAATEGTAPGQATTSTPPTSSSLPASVQLDSQCIKADGQYLTLAGDLKKWTPTATTALYGSIVNDSDTLKTDLVELSPDATTDQQAELVQYEGALTQLATGSSQAAAGDLQSAAAALTGIAPQLGAIVAVIGQICHVGGG